MQQPFIHFCIIYFCLNTRLARFKNRCGCCNTRFPVIFRDRYIIFIEQGQQRLYMPAFRLDDINEWPYLTKRADYKLIHGACLVFIIDRFCKRTAEFGPSWSHSDLLYDYIT